MFARQQVLEQILGGVCLVAYTGGREKKEEENADVTLSGRESLSRRSFGLGRSGTRSALSVCFSFFRVKLHVLLTRNKQVYWSDWNRFLLLGGEQFKVRLYESVS